MSFTNAATLAKDAFLIKVKEQLDINKNTDNNLSYEGLKTRVKTCNRVAKIINKEMRNIMDELIRTNASGKIENFMSVMYLKMDEMIGEASNAHRRSYITSDKEITKIKKYSIKLQKNARKALDIIFDLMQNVDMSLIPRYDLIVSKHNNIQSGYWLRTRKPVNYVEEDFNYDDLSDDDYKPYEHISKTIVINSNSRPKRNIPIVDYTGMDTDTIDYDSDYEFEEDDEDDEFDSCVDEDSNDDDSEYNPSDDEEFEDDHVLEFCDDDYAEETEEDDDDYEDEDESNQEDNEFLSDYYNDPDYTSNKNVVDVDYDDDSEYIPDENDELDDDHVLEFDDDDYAEESEEDDDDYEDESEDDEDKQIVSDYHNDPDYNPDDEDDEEDEEDELEYDYSFLNKKVDENENIVLKAGIADDDDDDDNDDDDEEYIPEDDEDDEDDEEEYVMYSCKKDNLITVCKRMYDRNTGKVRYNWIDMNENDYAKKYDEDYVYEEN
jgi:hypothetical protein